VGHGFEIKIDSSNKTSDKHEPQKYNKISTNK